MEFGPLNNCELFQMLCRSISALNRSKLNISVKHCSTNIYNLLTFLKVDPIYSVESFLLQSRLNR